MKNIKSYCFGKQQGMSLGIIKLPQHKIKPASNVRNSSSLS